MQLFCRPALVSALAGYNRDTFVKDLGAGLTVGVIALPLAIGFAIASGVQPGQGLWTAIVAGAIISAFGGSRFQIGGPTGAFVPVLAAIVAQYGYSGLALVTMMAGIMLIIMGLLKLGALLKFIPYPVVAGFTSGIAVIIFTGQLPEFLGMNVKLPEHVPQQLSTLWAHAPEVNPLTLAVSGISLAVLIGLPFITKRIPASIVAVLLTTGLVAWLKWPVSTIGSKFGGLAGGWPVFQWPAISLDRMRELMAPAFTVAALGAIESLLSASVADGMKDTRHDSNQELLGQGLANLFVPLFGGIAATGAIARTAANIRNGAQTPVAGLIHSAFLLIVVLVAAPYVQYIPIATLSAILIVVAVRMAEAHTFVELWRGPRTDFFVLLVAFGLTVVFDLTIGVGAGLLMSVALFVRRMEAMTRIRLLTPETDIEFDGSNSLRGKEVPPGVVLYRFEGPLFFAAAEKLEVALRSSGGKPKIVIFRMRYVPIIDATGLHAIEVAVEKMHRDGVQILITAVQPQPMKVMHESGLVDRIGLDNFCGSIEQALALSRRLLQPGVERPTR